MKMVVKIYAMIWALVLVSALGFYAAGEFTALTGIAYGFIFFGLIFMGMLAILPSTFHNEHHSKSKPRKPVQVPAEVSHQAVELKTGMIEVSPAVKIA